VTVEGHNSFSPVELDHHESVQVGVVLCARQVVVRLDKSVSRRLSSREKIMHLGCGVVVDVPEGLNVRQPLHIPTVVLKPNGSVESHLVVLRQR
jgi:hypothetical protein